MWLFWTRPQQGCKRKGTTYDNRLDHRMTGFGWGPHVSQLKLPESKGLSSQGTFCIGAGISRGRCRGFKERTSLNNGHCLIAARKMGSFEGMHLYLPISTPLNEQEMLISGACSCAACFSFPRFLSSWTSSNCWAWTQTNHSTRLGPL